MRSAYEVLGVEKGANDDTVRKRYLDLAKVLHPDVNKRSTATAEFKELKRAYDILKDPDERTKHDYALAKIDVADVPDDIVDDVLRDYGIDKPRKKKKKKKKKQAEAQQQVYAQPQPQPYVPPYQPPPPSHYGYDDRRGRGEFEGIPEGYDNRDTLGGIL